MDPQKITMEFDFAPFKKAVTEILLNEVRNHVYASRDSYTQSYDVRGFINTVWKEIDLEAIRKEVREEIQHIVALDRFLHLKNPLSETEINFIAEQIIDEFGGALTFADVHLVLKDAKAGKYGKFYERLSAPDVLDWFRTYFSSRLDAAYEINLRHDKATYGHVPSASIHEQAANLARLGYVINPDGTVGVNSQRVEKINAEIERKRQEELDKEAERINKDNAEAQFMAQYREAEKNGTVKEFLESSKNKNSITL